MFSYLPYNINLSQETREVKLFFLGFLQKILSPAFTEGIVFLTVGMNKVKYALKKIALS